MTAASTVYLPGLLILGIVSGVVAFCVNLMLLWGAIRRRRSLMMPWIVIGIVLHRLPGKSIHHLSSLSSPQCSSASSSTLSDSSPTPS